MEIFPQSIIGFPALFDALDGCVRTGDPARIAGYCGNSEALDEALAQWAESYGDQTEDDHSVLLAAIKRGDVKATIETDEEARNAFADCWHTGRRGHIVCCRHDDRSSASCKLAIIEEPTSDLPDKRRSRQQRFSVDA